MREYIGIDIGGTKCGVVRGDEKGIVLERQSFPTTDRDQTLNRIFEAVNKLWTEQVKAIGISCGGPLDSKKGLILGPPNLPGWDRVPITELLQERFLVPTYLENDADACAVAEWRFGAGHGCENMIFLTFGTGLGAGLILNGKLYKGTCGMAGEVGHVRLFDQGHIGYGKKGSYEGYCSGGGIAQYGLGSARELAGLAGEKDEQALKVWQETGECLGRLLAILVDMLNPERIVIGSIYVRAGQYMRDTVEDVLKKEALAKSREVCKVVPAGLGESLGDMASLCVAMNLFEE
ncbi:MAG: ROK family protein [Lachnospiraceae bacterium]|jgi:glucokinase|nr:ROK family protein [Lachnospiraceae bacterium]